MASDLAGVYALSPRFHFGAFGGIIAVETKSQECMVTAATPITLDCSQRDLTYVVVGVDGDDALAQRLDAAGVWPGVRVQKIGKAPFGDPLLFRLHGYRLALRRAEAARIRVTVDEAPR